MSDRTENKGGTEAVEVVKLPEPREVVLDGLSDREIEFFKRSVL